jgi:hypothetical protein
MAVVRLLLAGAALAHAAPGAAAQQLVCSPPAFGGCGDEWPRACWQGGAVTWRWSFALASMAALMAQHRKLWRRRSSKGVALPMLCLGCGSMVCEAIAQLIARLRVRPRWRGWEWSSPELTPLVVQLLLAALWLSLYIHAVHWAPTRSRADSQAREAGILLFQRFSVALGGLLLFVLALLGLQGGACGIAIDLGCLLAACADAMILLAWLPQIQLSASTGSVGAVTIPGALIGGLGQCGAAATLSDCAVAGSAWLAPLVSGLEQMALFMLLVTLSHRHALARRANWVGADAQHAEGEAQGLLEGSSGDDDDAGGGGRSSSSSSSACVLSICHILIVIP